MSKFLRIALRNANGLSKHKDEIQLFLHQNKIDILLISETHFTTKSYFNIPHYTSNIYCTNRPDGTAHAGTAVIVKQTISHYELPKYEEDFFQATPARVRTLPYESTVTAVYSPPKCNLKRDHYEMFSYNYHQRQRAIQPFQKKELLILNYRKPNILPYGSQKTNGSLRFLRHKRNFFIIHS
jgi:hypothetical protein